MKLEIALVIPASNKWKIEANNSAGQLGFNKQIWISFAHLKLHFATHHEILIKKRYAKVLILAVDWFIKLKYRSSLV